MQLFIMWALCDCLILVIILCVACLTHRFFKVRLFKMCALCVCLLTVQILLVTLFTQTFFKVGLVTMRALSGHMFYTFFILSYNLPLHLNF